MSLTLARRPGVTTLHVSSDVNLKEYVCCASNRTPCAPETATGYEVVFVRRGTFTLWTHKRARVMTPNEILFFSPGSSYSASHPIAGGDECAIISCSRQLLDAFFGASPDVRVTRASARLFLSASRLFSTAARGMCSDLEMDEGLLAVVSESLRHFDIAIERRTDRASPHQRRYVRRAQELIAERSAERLPLTLIASVAGTSPFHLSRLFRNLTGTSMHRYQTEMRLRAALSRILDGADDLGLVAIEAGFSSHSHFTSAFRRTFGLPPVQFKELDRYALASVPRRVRNATDRVQSASN